MHSGPLAIPIMLSAPSCLQTAVSPPSRLHCNGLQVIMDGNARWAARRGLSTFMGHQAGLEAFRETVTACSDWGVQALTVRGVRRSGRSCGATWAARQGCIMFRAHGGASLEAFRDVAATTRTSGAFTGTCASSSSQKWQATWGVRGG